ncbi:MAG: hypothetical protein ACMVP2_15045 [Imperialibacter sp.]|uniref:hypothetical protein n=1 Tax=Imperialibacter sp. TaxID=2038411 RepID=UPI003A880A26
MNLINKAIGLLLASSCFFACGEKDDNTESGEQDQDSVNVVAEQCLHSGELKQDLYAIVSNIPDGGGFIYKPGIVDTTRMRQYVGAWMPYVCNGFPDSLKQEGLELLVTISDKTVGETSLSVSTIDLVEVALLKDQLDKDPRNGDGVSTADINISQVKGPFYTGYVINSTSEWEAVSQQTGATMGGLVDFESQTLLGYKIMVGGCWPGGHFEFRRFIQDAEHQFRLHIGVRSYGLCQVGYARWHWVTVDKLTPEDEVEFSYKEEVIAN